MTLSLALGLVRSFGTGLFHHARGWFGRSPAAARGSLATASGSGAAPSKTPPGVSDTRRPGHQRDAAKLGTMAADGAAPPPRPGAHAGIRETDALPRPVPEAAATIPSMNIAADMHCAAAAMPERDVPARVLRVVVAHDNAADRQHMAALLEAAGHSVTLVADGRKAVEAVRNGRYDIVLAAVRMPIMHGAQAASHIRALPSPKCDIPIVGLVTGAAHGPQEHHHRGAGMDAYMRTPLSSESLGIIHALTASGRPPCLLADGAPTLDKSAVDTLRAFLTPEQLDALLAESLIDIAARIKRLGTCLALEDEALAAKEAHDLVSVAGNCGASALSALARDIERACKQDRLADATQAFARMPGAAAEAYQAVAGLRRALAFHRPALKDGITAHLDSH